MRHGARSRKRFAWTIAAIMIGLAIVQWWLDLHAPIPSQLRNVAICQTFVAALSLASAVRTPSS